MKRLGIVAAAALPIMGLAVWAGSPAGQQTPTRAQLEQANPLESLPTPPLGINRRLEDLDQPPTPETVRLGRWLFFDTRLSLDNTISCATCHIPEHGYSEPLPVSVGVDGKKGERKAPPILNQAWPLLPHFFWDGRAASLEEQAEGPMVNPVEMAMPDHDLVVQRIQQVEGYRPFFEQAFGDDRIDLDRILHAIADYERTRFSGNSPWDRWQAQMDPGDHEVFAAWREYEQSLDDPYGDPIDPATLPKFQDGPHVSAQVKQGHLLFHGKAGCNQCHLGFDFTDWQFHNLGVGWDEQTQTMADAGRYEVTGDPADMGAFKTPTLREVALRAPYMHDGSEKTLRELLELYNRGGIPNPNLSPLIRPLGLTDEEIDALVAFMEALSGEGYMDQAPSLFPQ